MWGFLFNFLQLINTLPVKNSIPIVHQLLKIYGHSGVVCPMQNFYGFWLPVTHHRTLLSTWHSFNTLPLQVFRCVSLQTQHVENSGRHLKPFNKKQVTDITSMSLSFWMSSSHLSGLQLKFFWTPSCQNEHNSSKIVETSLLFFLLERRHFGFTARAKVWNPFSFSGKWLAITC